MERKETGKMKTLILYIFLYPVFLISCQMGHIQKFQTEYIFPEAINKAINEKISSYKEYPEWKFYLTVSRVVQGEETGNYQVFVNSYKDEPIDVIAGLISKSNRYYQFDDSKVPIIFDYDFTFIGYGTDSKGRVVRSNVTGNGYLIEFDKTGKIVDTGN